MTKQEKIRKEKIKHILTIMLFRKELFKDGLCSWAVFLCDKHIISHSEASAMLLYIDENTYPSWFRRTFLPGGFYVWRKGRIKPRIRWIKKHIVLNTI